MLQREPLKDRALHRWPGILAGIGLPAKALTNRHGPCPMCGGKDRFRFDNKDGRGTWICSQCGAGDGIELVKRFLGYEFKQAANEIEKHLGSSPVSGTHGPASAVVADTQREEMIALWTRAKPIQPDDHAARYLEARTGLTAFPPCLRFVPDERYVEAGQRATWHPMMVAKVDPSDAALADGWKAALHRTYIDLSGRKADAPTPRKMMGAMPPGASVRLMEHGEVLGIAEGIETALSASQLFRVPTWAALTASLLEMWTPPPTVQTLYVFGDNDRKFTGQAAAHTLANRLAVKGLTVLVEIPATAGEDWNDVYLRTKAGARDQ